MAEDSPDSALYSRIAHGGKWAFGIRIVNQGVTLLKTVVLARLLQPQDFGLFGIALLILSAFTTFSQPGFDMAIIQKRGDVRPYLDTAWVFQLLRGFAVAILLMLIAPYVSQFFGEPAATPLIRVVGISLVFKSLANIGVVYFQKELDFKKQFLYEVSGTSVSFFVSIVLAFTTRSVWALVWGLIAGQIVSSAMSYAIQEYRPRFRYDGSKARELFDFGGWVWGSHILGFVALNGDDVVLGKLLGVRELGFYQTAFRLSQMPANEITQITSKVMFPAYSKIQQNASQLRRTYLHHLQFVSSVVFPLAGGIFVLGNDFTRLVLGQQWMPLVLPLQLLSIAGLLRAIIFTGAPLFMAVGKPKIDFYMTLMRVVVMAVTVIPFTEQWGMAGTCLSVISGIVSVIPIWVYQSTRPFSLSLGSLFSAFFSPLIGTLAFLVPGLVIVNTYSVGFVGMIGIVLTAVGVYLLVQYLFWRRFRLGAMLTWQRLLGQL